MLKNVCAGIPLLVLALGIVTPVIARDTAVQMGDGPDGAIVDGKPVEKGWKSLFDGKTLKGWMGEKGYWEVKEGAIVGTQPEHAPLHHYLFSTKDYSDFDLHIDVKLVGYNSGVCIRIAPESYDSVPGYQVDMGDGYWGCLWEEHKRQTKVFSYPKEDADKILHKDDWNHYFVRAVGHHITIYLNGVKTVDGDDPQGLLSGPLGFQLCHAGPEVASFKNIYIKTLKPPTKGTAPLPPDSVVKGDTVKKTASLDDGAIANEFSQSAAFNTTLAPGLRTLLIGHPASCSASFLSDWETYTSRDGRYSARFPATPKPSTSKTAGGRTMKSVVAETEAGAYMVMTMALGTTPDEDTANRSLDGAARRVRGQGALIFMTATVFRGCMAREVVIQKDLSGKPTILTDMIFIAKDRLIQVMTVIAKDSEERANTRKFQGWFKLNGSA